MSGYPASEWRCWCRTVCIHERDLSRLRIGMKVTCRICRQWVKRLSPAVVEVGPPVVRADPVMWREGV